MSELPKGYDQWHFILWGKLFGFEVREYRNADVWHPRFNGVRRWPILEFKAQSNGE